MFTLVNNSAAQLKLCRCRGEQVHADAAKYTDDYFRMFDIVVIAYMLGHVDQYSLLHNARNYVRGGGTVVVLDIFDANAATNARLLYNAPKSELMGGLGFKRLNPGQWYPVLPEAIGTVPGLYINYC
jgi:hypothetical protein